MLSYLALQDPAVEGLLFHREIKLRNSESWGGPLTAINAKESILIW